MRPTRLGRAARWLVRAARFGHLATGTVYLLVGGIAVAAALDMRVMPMGSQGALHKVLVGPLGRALLLLLAAGLAGDFVWQLFRAAVNADRAPRSAKGLADRIGWAISGVMHLGLAVTALKLAFAVPQRTAEHQARATTAAAMTIPLGRWLVLGVAVAIVLAALQLCYRAWIGDVDRWLDLREIDRPDRALVLALGRFGLAARGLVFGTGGVILASAALHGSPWAARGLGGTLRVLQASAGGPVVLAAIGVGLMSFGVIEVVSAHLRRSLPHDEAAAG